MTLALKQLSDTFKGMEMPHSPDWLDDGGLHHLFFPAYRSRNVTKTVCFFFLSRYFIDSCKNVR